MVVYRRKVSHSIGKWILALVLFVAAMTITFDDVEGTPLEANPADQVQSVVQK